MTNLMNLRLKGVMTSVSPICIVPPGGGESMQNGEKALKVAHEVIYHEGRRIEVPCIPSSTLRGALRRAASMVAMAPMFSSGKKLRLSDYVYNTVGGSKGSEDEEIMTTLKRAERRQANPVVALFGAAKPWATSHALIQTAYADPKTNDTGFERVVRAEIVGGRRTDDVAANPGILSLMTENAEQDWLELRKNTKGDQELRKKIEKLEKKKKTATPEEKTVIDAEIAAIEKEKSGENALLRPLHHFTLPRGTRMIQEITLRDVTAVEAGLFISALDRFWMETPYFGGKIAHGYGLVRAEWDILQKDGLSWKDLGKIEVEPHMGVISAPDVTAHWTSAWEDYRDSGAMNLAMDAA